MSRTRGLPRWNVGLVLAVGTSLAGCGVEPAPAPTLIQNGGSPSTNGGSANGGNSSDAGALGGSGPGGFDNGPIFNRGGSDNSGGSGNAGGTGNCTGDECDPVNTPPSNCGNSELDDGEQCDDGNARAGDGCTGLCNLEPNFACEVAGQACTTTIACGDGQAQGTEACDDGNTTDGDGCSASCTVETGFSCTTPTSGAATCAPTAGEVVCGDGVLGAGESCDDNDVTGGDGCSATCQQEAGYECPTVGQPCSLTERCGDGFLRSTGEQCDDGNSLPFDGCSSTCTLEPNFQCAEPGQPCASTIVCGDSQITGNESCDDGNTTAGDGCSANCFAEAGYDCTNGVSPTPGPCTAVVEARCGDGILAATEFCDDGNLAADDGCGATCRVELAFDCSGEPSVCTRVAFCGDGAVNAAIGEQCDDGGVCVGGSNDAASCTSADDCPDGACTAEGADGCSANCLVESDFDCPSLGGSCTSLIVCGDGIVRGTETCDVPGVGCNDCQIQEGFVCAGGVCRAECGDGIRSSTEACDDGDTDDGDGCSANCQLEAGFKCDDPTGGNSTDPDVCSLTTCQDGLREGTEQCDDGNDVPFDGCDAQCRNEPSCGDSGSGYQCNAVCGDGLKYPVEACDDGNTNDGDGCSSICQLEPGFDCTNAQAALASSISLPIIYRDLSETHPQMELNLGTGQLLTGIVEDTLSAEGKPVYNSAYSSSLFCGQTRAVTMDFPAGADNPNGGTTNACGAPTGGFDAAAAFDQWYTTDETGIVNREIVGTLPLDEIGGAGSGVYQFAASGANQFFRIDGEGFGNQGRVHNFHFTSEVRQAFVFDPAAPPTLTFRGDDDVWVFVNGQLTVDLGGIHGERTGRIAIGESSSELCIGPNGGDDVDDFDNNPGTFCQSINLTLDPNDVNEIAVFQAERHVTESNYTLTLEGFNAPITSCSSVCGDGVVTADEGCDRGNDNETPGTYDACGTDCQLGPFCGDGLVQQDEQCDNGLNTSTRLLGPDDCAAGCLLPSSCGDGQIDGVFGEQCDDGVDNQSVGTYDRCDTNCNLGPRCGDGVPQPENGEQCDDGSNNGSGGSACQSDCQLRCGNGVTDQGEVCDDGINSGEYGTCTAQCQLAPRCGDAVVDATFLEVCDDGLNDGSYGTCGPDCRPGPFCGDGETQAEFDEQCDNGSSNADGYGPNLCSTQCRPAPFCGDSRVDVSHGEACDDGVNSGQAGSCTTDCTAAVSSPACGNGVVDSGEQCDLGSGTNGAVGEPCDVRCQVACGNGFVDSGEQCDDGVNSGAYGSCNSNCTLASFCGDGVQDSNESCDSGSQNVAPSSAYGDGLCTTQCRAASRCGDGRVDSQFGEQCDGSASCSNSCQALQ